jgi:hypothetical protein
MDMETFEHLTIEAVMFGYHDPRINISVPFGFAVRSDQNLTVHYREDIGDTDLPRLFRFTAKNLPKIIGNCWKKQDIWPPEKSLHEFLKEACFGGLGDFRVWSPLVESLEAFEVDGYVLAVRQLVDREVDAYHESFTEYAESCNPQASTWRRSPEPSKMPKMPALAS